MNNQDSPCRCGTDGEQVTPVARALIESYSRPADRILDPFCGSGSLLVEALVAGRSVVGTDVDPLSVFVTRAKVQRYRLDRLRIDADKLEKRLRVLHEEDRSQHGDFMLEIRPREYHEVRVPLEPFIPPIPSLGHWFRRRVTLQLAAIRRALHEIEIEQTERLFFWLCFASIIRNASNADPVPVSGLEVTKHMRRREAEGRAIDAYDMMLTAVRRALDATDKFVAALAGKVALVRVALADARDLSTRGTGFVDRIITSPPYPNAVDYYRRHQLEMFWLGLVASARERLTLLPRYIGRDKISKRDMAESETNKGVLIAEKWLITLAPLSDERIRSFMHYCVGMRSAFERFATLLRPGARVVIVIGNGQIQGQPLLTKEIIRELASPMLQLEEEAWYPLSNRYMSYTRRNGADIDTEYVLVFRSANGICR